MCQKARLLHVGRNVRLVEVDEGIMSKMIQTADLTYTLHVGDKIFHLENVSVMKSKIPVRKPTTRGGIYFTDTMAYKIKASTGDMSVLSLLTKIMLGPNTEFQPVEVKTRISVGGKTQNIVLVSHVSNTVNTKTRVELNMIVDRTI